MFREYCASCHGITADGTGPAAAALKVAPPDLQRITERRGGAFPAADIAQIIDGRDAVAAHGSREMPVWGRRLGERYSGLESVGEAAVQGEIAALVEFLRSLQK